MAEQPELPIDWPPYDHYTVEIRKGPAMNEETLRSHKADDVDDAVALIEGLRDSYAARANVTWQDEEVNGEGNLYGLDHEGTVYLIKVAPPLTTDLS